MGVMLIINGLANNTVIPIASTLANVYEISNTYVSAPITISFLVYSMANFPANHIIDTKGLKLSLLLGASLFAAGSFCFALVNKGYYFTIFGAILVAIGQPFIINCPAKVATYWFLDQNVHNDPCIETIGHSHYDRTYAHWYRSRLLYPNIGSFRRRHN